MEGLLANAKTTSVPRQKKRGLFAYAQTTINEENARETRDLEAYNPHGLGGRTARAKRWTGASIRKGGRAAIGKIQFPPARGMKAKKRAGPVKMAKAPT